MPNENEPTKESVSEHSTQSKDHSIQDVDRTNVERTSSESGISHHASVDFLSRRRFLAGVATTAGTLAFGAVARIAAQDRMDHQPVCSPLNIRLIRLSEISIQPGRLSKS